MNDVGAPPAYIVYPGPDGKLGTGDDIFVPLSNFTRTIAISDLAADPGGNVRDVLTVSYTHLVGDILLCPMAKTILVFSVRNLVSAAGG